MTDRAARYVKALAEFKAADEACKGQPRQISRADWERREKALKELQAATPNGGYARR